MMRMRAAGSVSLLAVAKRTGAVQTECLQVLAWQFDNKSETETVKDSYTARKNRHGSIYSVMPRRNANFIYIISIDHGPKLNLW